MHEGLGGDRHTPLLASVAVTREAAKLLISVSRVRGSNPRPH